MFQYQKEILDKYVENGYSPSVSEIMRIAIRDFVNDLLNNSLKYSLDFINNAFIEGKKDNFAYLQSFYINENYIKYLNYRKWDGFKDRSEQIRLAIDYFILFQSTINKLLVSQLEEFKLKKEIYDKYKVRNKI